MKKELRTWLESKAGLSRSATTQDAWKKYKELDGDLRAKARKIRAGTKNSGEGKSEGGDPPVPGNNGNRNLTDGTEAVRAERERVAEIRSIFDGDFPELQRQAEDEGWDRSRASEELLQAIRNDRSEPAGGAPFIHSRGSDQLINTASLQAAVMLRAEMPLDSDQLTRDAVQAFHLPSWVGADINSEERQRAMDAGYQLRHMSLIDLTRASLQLAGKPVTYNRQEISEKR